MGSMRFRNLTEIELEALSEELVQFLIVQGIDGDLWLEMNQKSPQKAIELVSLFSDTVLEKVYSKVPGEENIYNRKSDEDYFDKFRNTKKLKTKAEKILDKDGKN